MIDSFIGGVIEVLRVAVCEDDPIQSRIIVTLLKRYKAERPGMDVQVSSFSAADSLLQGINKEQAFDLFLLDILLPEMNGIALAKELRAIDKKAPLVFLTSSTDYALDAFSVNASQYILKPVKHNVLFPILDDIIENICKDKELFFALSMKRNIVRIPHSSIICIELVGRILRFYLDNGEVLVSSTIRISFKEAISSLLDDQRFLCEHKSFALNMDYVDEIRNNTFVMRGGIEVPIPRYNIVRAREKYLNWLNERK